LETAVIKKSTLNLIIATTLIVLAVSLRLLPHPANFAPVAAVAIFGGAILPRRLAIWVPLAAMMASDMVIGFYNTMPVTWSCYVLIAVASSYWLKKPTARRGLALTVSASLFFFVVTNFAVWLWSSMYAHSWSGLAQCYAMALPFFRNTALSDLIYTAVLFTAYAVAIKLGSKLSSGEQQKYLTS
jgi:hypothetical protein